MAGTRLNNTQAEGLMSLLQQLAALKAAPDADIEMIAGIESQVLDAIKRPQQEAMMRLAQAGGVVPGMGGGPPAASPMPGAAGGGPEMGGGAPPMGGGGPTPAPAGPSGGHAYSPWGVMKPPSLPPVDELRRLVASGRPA